MCLFYSEKKCFVCPLILNMLLLYRLDDIYWRQALISHRGYGLFSAIHDIPECFQEPWRSLYKGHSSPQRCLDNNHGTSYRFHTPSPNRDIAVRMQPCNNRCRKN